MCVLGRKFSTLCIPVLGLEQWPHSQKEQLFVPGLWPAFPTKTWSFAMLAAVRTDNYPDNLQKFSNIICVMDQNIPPRHLQHHCRLYSCWLLLLLKFIFTMLILSLCWEDSKRRNHRPFGPTGFHNTVEALNIE